MSQLINKKICLLGEFGVGKTSLIRRFVHDIYSDDYITTIGVKVSDKIMPPLEKNGRLNQFRFLIWDIAGSVDGHTKYENYWAGASGALIVADLCREETFFHSKSILEQFQIQNPDARIVFIGNKTDLKDTAAFEEIKSRIDHTLNRPYPLLLTSAKTGHMVQESFLRLAEIMLE